MRDHHASTEGGTGRFLRPGMASGIIALAAMFAWWAMIQMPGKSHCGPLPPPDEQLTRLAEELRRHVARLAAEIGERNLLRRPRQLAAAADYLKAELSRAGYPVRRQQFTVSGHACCNLDVEVRGATRCAEIVVIGAHYDSVIGTPGANDNASGVAALLALAARFQKRRIERTLRFVAFANEEPPYFQTKGMGSLVYARRCRQRQEKVNAMLSLETIGYFDDRPGTQQYPPPLGLLYPSTGNFIAFVGNVRSACLVRRVVRSFRRHEPFPSEGGALPAFLPGVSYSDQWSFWEQGYPGVMVTDTAMYRYPHYHQPSDAANQVDYERLARVTRGLEQVIAMLAGSERP